MNKTITKNDTSNITPTTPAYHPQDNKQLLLSVARTHHGPLPTPEDLIKYDNICPGAADRIIQMAEKEQKSLHKIREKEQRCFRLGLILGFLSLTMLMFLTGYALYTNSPWVATVLIATVSGCTLLISRKKTDNKLEDN